MTDKKLEDKDNIEEEKEKEKLKQMIKLLEQDMQDKINNYLSYKIITPKDALYYIKCFKTENMLPRCLNDESRILDTNTIRNMAILTISKIYHDLTKDNYEYM